MTVHQQIPKLEDYEPYIGVEAVERILKKSEPLRGSFVTHINSTYYGGGVAELLSSLTLLMNSTGIKTGWRTINGPPDFFSVTKKMHNALQGADIHLTEMKQEVYEEVIYENAFRTHLHPGYVVVHDPQPLPMIKHFKKTGPWIWRCHIDLSSPHKELWDYLSQFVEKYDAAIFSIKEYRQMLNVPQFFFMPAIDPFAIKNLILPEDKINERLAHYKIPIDLPIVTQISRFDKWKDPEGVIRAFKKARKEVDCTLVLLGNAALDDPEGQEIFESVLNLQEERIIILSVQDTALVNALQRKAAVVLQKSLKEGFGLTVTEAMWKGTPVIGGNVGGIPYQIQDGVNGFLVKNEDETADRLIKLLKNEKLRKIMGEKGKEAVKQKFLMTRLLEDYLDLFNSFEICFKLTKRV